MDFVIFILLTLLSHIGASLFFAKPRFNKFVTAAIWLIYVLAFIFLKPNMMFISYFVTFILHLILFFVTTSGRPVEKGFLFFSYATNYTCFSTLYNIFTYRFENVVMKSLICILLMTLMQIILYVGLLPAFKNVATSIRSGWSKFYFVVLSFWALTVGQSLFAMAGPLSIDEIVVFLLTFVTYCVTYIAIFNGMKNIAELSREKQKSLQTELLQAQVNAQASEAQLVRQYRHDMRFHYQALMTYAKEGDTDKIVDYLNLQSESLEASTIGRYCENETINNILKVFNHKANNHGISMEICAAARPTISVPSPILVTVVANILENALHGAIESKSEKPFISVSVKHKSGSLVISCENSCLTSLNFEEMPEYMQGIGVHSVISSAEKYNGSCRFSAKDGVFRCVVVMDE